MNARNLAVTVFALTWLLGGVFWPLGGVFWPLRLRARYPRGRAPQPVAMAVRPATPAPAVPFDRNGTRYRW